mgnify:FL=1
MVGQEGFETHLGTLEVFHDTALDRVIHLVPPLELFLKGDEACRWEIEREVDQSNSAGAGGEHPSSSYSPSSTARS